MLLTLRFTLRVSITLMKSERPSVTVSPGSLFQFSFNATQLLVKDYPLWNRKKKSLLVLLSGPHSACLSSMSLLIEPSHSQGKEDLSG